MSSRRRLRVHYSSDEDDDEPQQQSNPQPQHQSHIELEELEQEEDDIEVEQLQHSTLNFETVTLNPNPNPPVPLEISDDEFIDVPDNFSPPPPPVTDESFQSSSNSRISSANSTLASDCSIAGFLERLGLRLRREWVDSCVQGLESSVSGFGSLDVADKAKLCFQQFLFSDMNLSGAGILPENVQNLHLVDLPGPFVLQVDEIVNLSCPLKGRYQNASPGLKRCLKLSMTDGVQRVFGMEYRPIKDLEVLAPAGLKVSVCNVNIRHGLLMLVPEVFEVLGGVVEDLEAARQRLVNEVNKPPRGKRTRTGVVPPLATRATLAAWPPDSDSAPGHTNSPLSQAAAPPRAAEQGMVPPLATRAAPAPTPPDNVSASWHADNPSSQSAAPLRAAEQGRRASGISTGERTTEEFAVPISRENAERNPSTTAVSDIEDIHMVDEADHPFILSGDSEIPFTYLASLSAKWAAVKDKAPNVQGKIKCFLTGVKGFQFKQRATFELCVFVDDGSLISEILIDHNVVQNGIGHSPGEVTDALTSSDIKKVGDMKEILKQFQIFLANFEGMMLVQISEASPCPVAIEMNQGCPPSDAWLLLRRLQYSNTAQPQHRPHFDLIDLSP